VEKSSCAFEEDVPIPPLCPAPNGLVDGLKGCGENEGLDGATVVERSEPGKGSEIGVVLKEDVGGTHPAGGGGRGFEVRFTGGGGPMGAAAGATAP